LLGEKTGGEAVDDLGVKEGEIVEFGGVLGHVEEFEARAVRIHEQLPIVVADGEDRAAVGA